mgnify:CR=1 FL=1
MKRKLICFICYISFINVSISQVKNLNCIQAENNSRIVSVGGSITEIIYLLKKENNLVAIDVTSVYPENTKKKPNIGYVRNLSTEGILSMSPSLIIGEDDMGPPNVIKQLRNLKLDLKIIEEKQNAKGIIEKIKCIGKILNIEKECDNIIREKINPAVEELYRIASSNRMEKKKVMLILSMKGSSPVVAGNNTSGDSFIKMLGAQNIYESVKGWKTVSEESIIKYNPEFIIIPQKDLHKNSNINNIRTNPVFMNTIAVKNNNIIIDDGMAILGFGPRTIFSALKSAKIISQKIQ